MKKHLVIQFVFLLLAGFFLSALLGALIHEGTHIAIFRLGGSKVEGIVVIGGIQIYPDIKKVEWTGYAVGVSMTECSNEHIRSLALAMGSSTNAIASYLLLGLVFLIRKGWRKKLVLLFVSLVLAWDLIAYSFFPLFGLRHWIFVGGDFCEPVEGASMLGIPMWLSYFIILVHFVLYSVLFVKSLLYVSQVIRDDE